MKFEPVDILLVEDNPADIRLTQEALKENKIKLMKFTKLSSQKNMFQ